MYKKFKLGVLQTACFKAKSDTLKSVEQAIHDAVALGSQVCVLGETFNSLYTKQYLTENAEDFSNPKQAETLSMVARLSEGFGVYVIGTIPEKESTTGRMYNTAFCYNPQGQMIAKYRKCHLFDIDIPGKITYKESDTFSPGDALSVFDTEFGRFGMGICYDIRFPEQAQLMREKGAYMLIYPGAFNQTTGPLHWELLLRGRANDNQVYMVGASTSRHIDDPTVYQAWGHSAIVDPYARVLAMGAQEPAILVEEIDFSLCHEVRRSIPVSAQRRKDLYHLSAGQQQ